jgi:hypothetical protein
MTWFFDRVVWLWKPIDKAVPRASVSIIAGRKLSRTSGNVESSDVFDAKRAVGSE